MVQAQYYKDPNNLEGYLSFNPFLPDINNELDQRSEQYARNLASLEKLVLYRFAEDTVGECPSEYRTLTRSRRNMYFLWCTLSA